MAIKDFWCENLKDKGITESSPCYYITRAKDIKDLPNGKMAIPQTSAIMNAFYLPYLYGDSQSWVASDTLTDSANIFPVNVDKLASPEGVAYGERSFFHRDKSASIRLKKARLCIKKQDSYYPTLPF